jgi:hypothetical protein
MSNSGTCNPYFVKFSNLRNLTTSTFNGESPQQRDDPMMQTLKSFLHHNPNVAQILSSCQEFSLPDVFRDDDWDELILTLKHEIKLAEEKKTISNTEEEIQKSVANMSEWQKQIWDDVIYESSNYDAQLACLQFIQLLSSEKIFQDNAYKEACKANMKILAAFEQTKKTAQQDLDAQRITKTDYWQKLGEARDARTSSKTATMRKFLQKHNINAGFAETLVASKMAGVIVDFFQWPDYISETQVKVQNRVEINDVTRLERHFWNILVTKQTPQEDHKAIKEFLKLALNAMGYTVANQYDNKYENALKPPDLYIRRPQDVLYRDDLYPPSLSDPTMRYVEDKMRGERACVEIYKNGKYYFSKVFWIYDERTKFFRLCLSGMYNDEPLMSLDSRNFLWTMSH